MYVYSGYALLLLYLIILYRIQPVIIILLTLFLLEPSSLTYLPYRCIPSHDVLLVSAKPDCLVIMLAQLSCNRYSKILDYIQILTSLFVLLIFINSGWIISLIHMQFFIIWWYLPYHSRLLYLIRINTVILVVNTYCLVIV